MKWFWRIAAVVAVVAGVTLGSYVHAHAATVCSKHPSGRNCPAVLTNQGAWAAAQRPRDLYMGNGHAPYLTRLRWTVDQHSEGKASGKLHTYKTACLKGPNPNGCKQYTLGVTIVLTRPKFHCGSDGNGCQDGWYWKVMNWKYSGSGFAAPRRWVVASSGFWR